MANHTFQRALDAALRVDGRGVLNAGALEETGGAEIAAELLIAVRMMEAEAASADGRVDYGRLRASEAYQAYRACTGRLVGFDPAALTSTEERLAFWINLYNALILDAVITFGIRGSIREDLGLFRRARLYLCLYGLGLCFTLCHRLCLGHHGGLGAAGHLSQAQPLQRLRWRLQSAAGVIEQPAVVLCLVAGLPQAEAQPVPVVLDTDDLHGHHIALVRHFLRVVDAPVH